MHTHLCNRTHTEPTSTFPDSNVEIKTGQGEPAEAVCSEHWVGEGGRGGVTSHHHRQTRRRGEGLGHAPVGAGGPAVGA